MRITSTPFRHFRDHNITDGNNMLSLQGAYCYTAKCGRRNAEVRVASMGVALTGSLALAEEPTFHNVFRLPVNKSVPKNKVTLH